MAGGVCGINLKKPAVPFFIIMKEHPLLQCGSFICFTKLYHALTTQTILVGRINALLVLVSAWDFSDNMKNIDHHQTGTIRLNIVTVGKETFQNYFMHCINRPLSLSLLVQTSGAVYVLPQAAR